MRYKVKMRDREDNIDIVIVGTGGTGSFVAEGVCRLLHSEDRYRLLLIDHDRVEETNLRRQNF